MAEPLDPIPPISLDCPLYSPDDLSKDCENQTAWNGHLMRLAGPADNSSFAISYDYLGIAAGSVFHVMRGINASIRTDSDFGQWYYYLRRNFGSPEQLLGNLTLLFENMATGLTNQWVPLR